MDKKEDFADVLRKQIGLALCICLGLVFLIEHFRNPEITQEEDLTTLDVTLEDYTFERYENQSRRSPTYYLKTIQYKNLFIVTSDDIWLFNMNQFESDSLKNKSIQIKIPNKQKVALNQPDKAIQLYEISGTDISYLSSKKTLRENQGPLKLMTSIGFFGLAGFLIILIKKKL